MAGVMITDQNDQYDQTHSKWKTVKISETDLVSNICTKKHKYIPENSIYNLTEHVNDL